MKIIAIIVGTVALVCSFMAQVDGWGEGYDAAVYHQLWWAACGGFLLAGGFLLE